MYKKNIKKLNHSKTKNYINKKFYLMAFVVLVAIVFYTIRSINVGSKLNMLEEQEEALLKENRGLSAELTSYSSLSKIEELSESDGFVKPKNIVYINDEREAVAKLR